MDFADSLHKAKSARGSLQYQLDMMFVPGVVNEVGVLWRSEEDHAKFASWMGKCGRERYLTDAQVVYALKETPRGDVKEYRYHVRYDFFDMGNWRLQSQVQMHVNPLRVIVDPLFEAAENGSVIHGSYRSKDLEKELETWNSERQFVLARFTSSHSESAYIGELGNFPYLHPRRPHQGA